MIDLFKDKAKDWDERPVPAQISEGVFDALKEAVAWSSEQTVMDFGAGTGLVCTKLAPLVKRVVAVDISQAMLAVLAEKAQTQGNVEVVCQNILDTPLAHQVDVVVSAMAMHHVEDTRLLLKVFSEHLAAGGQVALADLDAEDGDFHPPGTEGVYHAGFHREQLGALLEQAGFVEPRFRTACVVDKDAKRYPIFLVRAHKV